MKATVVSPGQVKPFWLVHDLITPLVSAEQTGGAYEVAQAVVLPGGGPPPHLHHREDEMFYVVDGTFAFVFDQTVIRGRPGTCVFLPRDVVHTFKNVGDRPATMVVVTTPGGFLEFARSAATPCTDPSAPPVIDPVFMARLEKVCGQFGIEFKPQWQANQPAPPRPKAMEYWVLGQHVRILLGKKDTAGHFSVVEGTSAPGRFVPPHLHHREDEMFYVLEGTYEFELEGRKITAPAGTFIHVPKGTMHGFANRSDRPARLVNYHTPGGFEDFFIEAGTECVDVGLGPPGGPLDMQWLMNLFTKHGMELAARP